MKSGAKLIFLSKFLTYQLSSKPIFYSIISIYHLYLLYLLCKQSCFIYLFLTSVLIFHYCSFVIHFSVRYSVVVLNYF